VISPSRVQEGARAAERDPAPMTLLADLEEFVRNHRPHGGLTGDATELMSNGYRLTVACACGVVLERWITPEADDDLIRLASLKTPTSRRHRGHMFVRFPPTISAASSVKRKLASQAGHWATT
jgi:hypothetical protein